MLFIKIVHNSETCFCSFVENAQKITIFVVPFLLWRNFLGVSQNERGKLLPKGVGCMEKIKHRTIRFASPAKRRSARIAALAGVILGARVIGLCLMVVVILS